MVKRTKIFRHRKSLLNLSHHAYSCWHRDTLPVELHFIQKLYHSWRWASLFRWH